MTPCGQNGMLNHTYIEAVDSALATFAGIGEASLVYLHRRMEVQIWLQL